MDTSGVRTSISKLEQLQIVHAWDIMASVVILFNICQVRDNTVFKV
jgi:hypothetical protein